MPATFDWSKTPKTYLDKSDKIGLLIGSLLAGGMGAATGRGGGDSILRGVAGATAGFGSGANTLEDNYSKMITDKMRRDQQEYENNMQNQQLDLGKEKFGFEKEQFEEMKPLREARMAAYTSSKIPKIQQDVNAYLGMNDEQRRAVMELKRAGRPLTKINMGGDAEKEEQKVIGKTLGESYQELQKDAMNARNEIDMFGTLKELSTQTETGKLEPFKTQLAGYAQALGAPINNRYNANQMFEAISNKLTVMARKVGEGQILAGQISDSDREFLKRSVPELGKLPGANKMLIDWNMKLADRRINLARLGEEYYNKNGTMKGFSEARTTWVKQNSLFPATDISPEQSPQSMPKEAALQGLFDLAQKGDPEALEYFRSKGIK